MSKGIDQIKIHEGLRNKVYKDTKGILTIGYGRNLEGRGITDEEAEYLLKNDVNEFVEEVNRKYPWVKELNEPRRWVIYNMAFNMGMRTLSTFVNTLKAIKEKRYEDASKGMLQSRWAKQVGKRAIDLSNQMKSGEWSEKP
jgi:lysozyme